MYLLICICALFGVLFIPGIFLVTEDDVMEGFLGYKSGVVLLLCFIKYYKLLCKDVALDNVLHFIVQNIMMFVKFSLSPGTCFCIFL
jgi:hypothetical protein